MIEVARLIHRKAARHSGIAMPHRPFVNRRMKPTDLAFSRLLGLVDAPPGAEHVLELPFTPAVQNHLGTVHAAAQFALAEAASAVRLQRDFGAVVPPDSIMAVVRHGGCKYRHPARGDLLAYARPDDATRAHLAHDLRSRTHSSATVLVELKDHSGQLVFAGHFDWLISRTSPAA